MQIVMSVLSAPVRSQRLWPSTRKRVALLAELMMFFCIIGSLQICTDKQSDPQATGDVRYRFCVRGLCLPGTQGPSRWRRNGLVPLPPASRLLLLTRQQCAQPEGSWPKAKLRIAQSLESANICASACPNLCSLTKDGVARERRFRP